MRIVGHFVASSASVKHTFTFGSPLIDALGASFNGAESRGEYLDSSNGFLMVAFMGNGPPIALAVSSELISYL
ncbi:hypothetical protein AR158_c181L [Paramecium bursaria Chlorella virus AR158]|uniref:hypothetical protein n=1 Tax=Paramecium bursaria Chlorella virus AR158 TaxID=380598 RepID=UPI00015AA848|nr:hypothetical protein AR158_c181L [Paramecium bursaria Chlorella virus AR158]ABU43727.1 hypothetical protein AR158_c181L [Paramecium bursaria Chlorella virus AR158]